MIFALLPIFVWLLLALNLFIRMQPRLLLREALIASAVMSAAWLTLTTELLSLFQAISFWPILGVWLVPALVLLLMLHRHWNLAKGLQLTRLRLSVGQSALVTAIAFCLIWSLVLGSFSAPGVGDSIAYHLQRQVFWMQNQSVENYSANSLRQLVMPPLAEFAGLHLMVLTGDDVAHNFLQWIAFLLTMIAATLITRKFNPSLTAQLLAALAVVTIPMAFIQASNTKNDDIVAMWVMISLYFTLQLADASPWSWRWIILVGLSFGALMLTKGTGLIFGLPLGVLFAVLLLRHHRRKCLTGFSIVAAIVLTMNAGHFYRNWSSFGTPFPNDPAINGGDTLANQDFSPPALVSNLARNLAPHFLLPSTAYNDRLTTWMLDLHNRLGIDVNDPRTTFIHGSFRPYRFPQYTEDAAAAPAQMLCILLLLALLPWVWKQVPGKILLLLIAIAAADFLLFSMLLKWQIWNVRLIVAILMLFAPVFAWTWSAPRLRYIAPLFPVILLLGLIPSLNIVQRPLFGSGSILTASRISTRFCQMPNYQEPTLALAKRIMATSPKTVAFYTGWSSVDYQLQRMLLDNMQRPPRFLAFNPIFRVPGEHRPDPDILLVDQNQLNAVDNIAPALQNTDTSSIYRPVATYAPYVVYLKQLAATAPATSN